MVCAPPELMVETVVIGTAYNPIFVENSDDDGVGVKRRPVEGHPVA